jgi:precorrin-6Y C5,15-methyltransferase (decarboxylating)
MASDATEGRWLSIVGIGEDGVAGLGETAKALVCGAEVVFGGRRHLALAGDLVTGRAEAWPTPFDVAPVLALKGRRVCVLASGDPMLFGVGATLARSVAAEEMTVVPAPSAFSLAAARLGWALQDLACVSVHGRAVELVRPHLQPGRKLVVLTSDGEGPSALARLLVDDGFGKSRLRVLEALGGPDERIRTTTAEAFDLGDVSVLNVVGIEVVAGVDARVLTRAPGLPDALFEHDGQITKRAIRALTLSALAPRRGELLWDVGAGAGSVAIEWMLADPAMRAIAVEGHPERAARIGRNAKALGVPGLRVVEGMAPAALAGLEPPDAVFVGGGGSEAGVMDAVLDALKSGGRIVANAVTLEMEAVLLEHHARLGGELVRLAVSRAEPVGGMTGWRPAMPVTQWSWTKP